MEIRTGLLASALVLSAAMAVPTSAQALQPGDYVISANESAGGSLVGSMFRLRGQELTVLFESGANGIQFSQPGDVIIDSQGRVVFGAGPCGGNSNSSALLRWDPATGVLTQLLCIPFTVGAGGPPPGFPPEATSFHGLNGLHATRSLKVSIDDDVGGGTPQAGFAEAYGFSIAVFPRPLFFGGQTFNRYRPEAFRYDVDENRVEPGVSTPFIPAGPNVGVEMFADSSATYYAQSQGSRIYRAEPDLTVDVRARTTVQGAEVVVSGRLIIAGTNELVVGPGPGEYPYFDNTAVPNVTLMCNANGVDITDSNNPLEPDGGYRPLSDIRSLGVLDGGIFVSTTSPSSAVFFNLAPRDPILNTFFCDYHSCTQGFGPYPSSVDRPYLAYASVHNNRILGGDDGLGSATAVGRVFAVTPSSFELLVADPRLSRPRGVAHYPPETPALTSAALVVRVDSPVNVLVTDAAGRRIGHDAAGNTVNDFGESGAILALGPEGHPRVYAVINPADGDYALSTVGTGTGPYTIRGYRADTGAGGSLATIAGTTAPGAVERLTLSLGAGLDLSFRRPCVADFNGDGTLDPDDLSDYITCFFTVPACPGSDFNGDGDVNPDDLSDYITTFFGGGC